MLDHVGIPVRDLDEAKAFYTRALEPLGYSLAMEFPGVAGFAAAGVPDFWVYERENPRSVHVAFSSPDRATVDAFHRAALDAGGVDNGAPGLRPQYHEHYYGAYVHDASGHNIEAVCNTPE